MDDDKSRAFIVMEYLEGATLKHRIAVPAIRSGPAVGYWKRNRRRTRCGSRQGHRDIKPANIFITEQTLSQTIWLAPAVVADILKKARKVDR